MTGLQVVFLSHNELEGPIPNNKAFITASLQGNKGLCGNLTGFQPSERPSTVVKKHSIVKRRHKLILITLLPVMGGLVLLYAFVGVLFMCDRRRRRAKDDGRRNDDGTIAVNRLHSSFEINTHPKSFVNEVRELTGIKHRNIVNHYGYCSYAQHSFLVYEYAERGSLSSILSNEVESKKLDWLKRVNSIKGVAFALSFMHQDCSPPIVHRDISSGNGLLDSEYEARVSDFGIAKLLTPDSSNFTALAGTYGYVAPGYKATKRGNKDRRERKKLTAAKWLDGHSV
ncbi:putative leucine-rich repeat receptor-like protein kinase-like [Capsicum annuum]|nr:putative leucine-rich repeat receptor-like protein kinase-like [Capsicum annuum]